MKKRPILASGIVILIIAAVFSIYTSAEYIEGFGNTYLIENETISSGLEYTEYFADNAGTKQHAYVFKYTPGTSTSLKVASNDSVYGRASLATIINTEQKYGNDVVAGINADFFSMQTGVPMGVYINDGKLLSSCDSRAAFGIRYDGTAVIGYPSIKISLTTASKTIPISHFNKYPTQYVSYLLDSNFSDSTRSTSDSTEIVISLNGTITPSSTVSGIIQAVNKNTSDTEIPDGCVVLSINNKSTQFNDFSSLKKGDLVSINFSCSSGWENVRYAFGGGDIIVRNSSVVSGVADETHEKQQNPRTAAGITSSGEIIFFAADGRSTDGKGLTLDELAQTMYSLGCVSAINLDGGGSTTVSLKGSDGTESMKTANSPSDGYQRKISTAVLFINSAEATDIPQTLSLSPSSAYILKGTSLNYSISVRDTSYKLMDSAVKAYEADYSLSNPSIGIMNSSKFTSTEAGSSTIIASATVNGKKLSGSASITVVDTIDDFSVEPETLRVPSGQKVKLNLTGYLSGLPVYVNAKAFTFSFGDEAIPNNNPNAIATCEAGYIGIDGYFHAEAGKDGNTATFTVYYTDGLLGEDPAAPKSIKISIRVGIEPEIVDDFDSLDEISDNFVNEPMSSLRYVADGWRSESALELSGYSVVYETPKVMKFNTKRFELWIKGELNGKAYICVTDRNGIQYNIYYYVAEDYSAIDGWTLLYADLPSKAINPISVDSPFISTGNVNIKLDCLTVNYGDSATIFNDIEESWAKDYITSLYNMQITDGSYDADGNRIYNPENSLTRAEFAKMLSVFEGLDTDKYAPAIYSAEQFYKDTGVVFADESSIPEWALQYIRAVVAEGYMSGISNGDGTVSFYALKNITRVEVMYVFGGILEQREITALIEKYYPSQEDTVSSGVHINPESGSVDSELPSFIIGGVISAPDESPSSSIDTLPKIDLSDIKPSEIDDSILEEFNDSASIPTWARERVKRTVAGNIIAGDTNKHLNPMNNITRAEIAVTFSRMVSN